MKAQPANRRILRLLVRVGVTVAALLWLALSFDWPAVFAQLAGLRWPVVLLAFAVFSLWLIPCALRWQRIAAACGYPMRSGESARAYLVGSFFNAFLPTGRGGDVVRALLVAREQDYPAGGLMATVFVERLTGFFVALGFVVVSALFALSRVEALRPALISAAALAVLIAVGTLVMVSPPVRAVSRKLLLRVAGLRMGAMVGDVLHVLSVTRRNPALLVTQAGFSLLNQLALIVSGFILAAAVPGFHAPWFSFPVVIPLIFVAGVLPSIGGYGVREVGYVVAFGWFGVNSDAAAAYSLLQLLFLWAMSLAGAVVFALSGIEKRAALLDRMPTK